MSLFDIFKKNSLSDVNAQDDDIVAIADGEIIDVNRVRDQVFSSQMMGKSVAFRFDSSKITLCSPANGTLSVLYPTGHAFGITRKDGVEILVHIGIDTVNAKGDGFSFENKKQGETVRAGDPIVTVDMKSLSKKYDMPVILIITNANGKVITFRKPGVTQRGCSILERTEKNDSKVD